MCWLVADGVLATTRARSLAGSGVSASARMIRSRVMSQAALTTVSAWRAIRVRARRASARSNAWGSMGADRGRVRRPAARVANYVRIGVVAKSRNRYSERASSHARNCEAHAVHGAARGVPYTGRVPACSSEVHIGQRVAARGIGIAQRGQSFVDASGSLMSVRAIMNTTNATTMNVMTDSRKLP